jgi:hypothetical protein
MTGILLSAVSSLLQRSVEFGADAPLGTGLEWMTVWALLLPALLLVLLAYLGRQNTA